MKINLLPPDERPLEPNAVRGEFLIAIVGILLLLLMIGFSIIEMLTVQGLEAEHHGLERHIAFLQSQRGQVTELQASVQQLEQVTQRYQDLVQDENTIAGNIDAILASVPQGLFLERIEVAKDEIVINGYTKEPANLSFYITALNQRRLVATIDNLEPHGPSGFIRFAIATKEGV